MEWDCFKILGLEEGATKKQIQEAYDRKAVSLSRAFYEENPKYAKKKLKELKKAYKEACRKAEGESPKSLDAVDSIEGLETTEPSDSSAEEDFDYEFTGSKEDFRVLFLCILLFVVVFGVLSCQPAAVNPSEFKTVYQYRDTEITPKDKEIEQIAQRIDQIYHEQMGHTGSVLWEDEPPQKESLPAVADQFAKVYWQKDVIAEVTEDLAKRYEDYPVDSGDTTVAQLDAIMLFYGFPTADETLYDRNPYTKEEIWGYTDHLHFLIDAYAAREGEEQDE